MAIEHLSACRSVQDNENGINQDQSTEIEAVLRVLQSIADSSKEQRKPKLLLPVILPPHISVKVFLNKNYNNIAEMFFF